MTRTEWIFVGFAALSVLVLFYSIVGRAWLKSKVPGFFALIEPVEIKLWEKSETILWARFRQVAGVLVAILTLIGAVDITPYLAFIPEKYQWTIPLMPLIISVSGGLAEYLRRYTSEPLAMTALPDQKPPEVAEAMAKVAVAKEEAVATIAVAKEEKKL